jgi:O-antigen biosynthesis protein
MLAADVLALHLDVPCAEPPSVELRLSGKPVGVKVHSLSDEKIGCLVVARLTGKPFGADDATLTIGAGSRDVVLGPAPLLRLCVDLRALVRERLAALPLDARGTVLKMLVSVAGEKEATDDPLGLSTSMALVHEGLREPLPLSTVERDRPQGIHIDAILALSERSFYVRGWALDAQASVCRLTMVSPEGARVELLPNVCRRFRPDVDQFYEHSREHCGAEIGFLGYFETPAPSFVSEGWVLEMENVLGMAKEILGPPVSRDILPSRDAILADLQRDRRSDMTLMDHAIPAVSHIQERLEANVQINEVVQFGQSSSDPETSIVVPLYGRIDFLEQQLAQFVDDPEIRESDLIYVLDSPELASGLLDSAAQLFDLYGVPFRVALLSANGGFSVANNRGASIARGRLLLLLNSDVLPDRPGWLSRMTAFYDRQDDIGVLGPKLLFEDDSLQHAGIWFQRPPGSPAWENMHFFKGLHRDLPAANVARRVPAVTGACLMIERALYEEVGGLRGVYVQGDYEDTDLCLRLREAGRETWYLPDVELYHLEGQSYALEARNATSRYNTWLHTHFWDEEIEQVMSSYASETSQL